MAWLQFGSAPWIVLVLVSGPACARPASSPTQAPAASVVAREPETPREDTFSFVSTSNNDDAAKARVVESDGGDEVSGAFAVRTAAQAKQLAEGAVATQLDPKKVWRTSPVFPSSWPAKDRKVAVYFHGLAAHPHSMSQYVLYSAAFRVDVSLDDGSTTVVAIPKPRSLGTIEQTRPTSLETRELELAESSLVRQLLGGTATIGENTFWGYMKFVHEHPEIGRDLERRQAPFMKWVRKKG